MTFEHATAHWNESQTRALRRSIGDTIHLKLWVDHRLDGLQFESGTRERLSRGHFRLAHEHRDSAILLVERGLFGSALAMAGLMLDTYVRGTWLAHCPTDERVDAIAAGAASFPGRAEMVAEIGDFLSASKNETVIRYAEIVSDGGWKALCDQTHDGALAILGRLDEHALDATYDPERISGCLDFMNIVSLLSFISIRDLSTAVDGGVSCEAALRKIREITAVMPIGGSADGQG